MSRTILRLTLLATLLVSLAVGPAAIAQTGPNSGGNTEATTPPGGGSGGGGASTPAQGDRGGNDSSAGWAILGLLVVAGAGIAVFLSRKEKAADEKLQS